MVNLTLEQAWVEVNRLLVAGDVNGAADLGLAMLVAEPKHPAVLYLLSVVRFRQEQWDEAVGFAAAALQASPMESSRYHNLCLALREIGDLDQAVTIAEAGLAVHPAEPDLVVLRLFLLLEAGRSDEVIPLATAAVINNDTAPLALAALGLVQGERGDHSMAMRYFIEGAQRPVRDRADHLVERAAHAIGHGNISYADLTYRAVLAVLPDHRRARNGQSHIASLIAGTVAPQRPGGYVLCKAMGWGFWSDMLHVFGAFLLAELTGRTPLVHWGARCLYGNAGSDDAGNNRFEQFFLPTAPVDLGTLAGLDCFPPYWDGRLGEEITDIFSGPRPAIGELNLLTSRASVLVVDKCCTVHNLMPWIGPEHPLQGRSEPELYRVLAEKYLRLVPELAAEIDAFIDRHMGGEPFCALHLRNEKKQHELPFIRLLNRNYIPLIERLSSLPDFPQRLFVMTDSKPLADTMAARFPDRVVTYPVERSSNDRELYYDATLDRRMLGRDVVRDVFTALRADWFIGNGATSVSCAIDLLKAWPEDRSRLLYPNRLIHFWDANPYAFGRNDKLYRSVPPFGWSHLFEMR
ncbi:MAG: hypothetical protein P4M00_21045 [Azospirillaceae bacterium]|nr:hypothetical protein [Azospirillaceae bacterium]